MTEQSTVDPELEEETRSYAELLDPEVLADPYPLYKNLRTTDPVHWDPYLHAWIVTGYDDVTTVLKRFSARRTPPPEYFELLGVPEVAPVAELMVRMMLFMDAPEHPRVRRLASAAFTPGRVAVLDQRIAEIGEQLIDAVLARGDGRMDLMADFADPLPAMVTTDLLGVPVEDHMDLKRWSTTFAEMLGNFQHNPERLGGVLEAVQNLVSYFTKEVEAQREKPVDGLVSAYINAEVDGDRFTTEEIVANCIVTMVGGLETTTNLFGNGLLALLRDPEALARLRAHPELMDSAVEELLRFESPSQHTARLAPKDLELGGKQIGQKQAVIAVMGSANRDPQRFHDPDRLDIARQDNRHVAFAWGAHFCFGAPLARLEGRIGFGTLLRRLPTIELVDEPLTWRENLGLRGLTALPLQVSGT
ncbi:cytochrome P450 [Actinomycetospora sp. TBRC 11914]|uniref:cytochrome P450 n=1 Tax=Actinomycetospora sp. TBRC 11914 TaxID=2729387 RepID=UPI00145C4B86|nr:cytochrome P450 [Actinomycetospora sp. TBRC 11914]NMO92804.1 cytochrome P450 [Actinomycetospora sp. TBRC 11914]